MTFRSRVIGLLCCENELTSAWSCKKDVSKNVSKFQQILATTMDSISRKESFLKLVNVLWKRTLAQLFFYIVILISSKLWKFPVHSLIRRDFSFSAFPFIDQERFFLFLWLFQMKGAVVQHSYIIKKLQLALIKKPNPSRS